MRFRHFTDLPTIQTDSYQSNLGQPGRPVISHLRTGSPTGNELCPLAPEPNKLCLSGQSYIPPPHGVGERVI